MLHTEVAEFSEILGKLVGVKEVSNVKIFVGKEKKIFHANSFLLAARFEKLINIFNLFSMKIINSYFSLF